jgi:hypothetical protein
MKRFQDLKAFARTERQTQLLEAIIEAGSMRGAAKALRLNPSTVCASVKRIERSAAMQGFAPDHDLTQTIPDTQYLKGASTLYKVDDDGTRKPVVQWIKTNAKLQDQLDCLREFAEALGETIKPAKPVKKKAARVESDYLTVYPLADVHLGLLAWGVECGEDYDLKIADKLIRSAAYHLTKKAEPSKHAIVANLGDFFHSDDDTNRTKASGAVLDGDGRWGKVVRLGVDLLKHFIDSALTKHENVHVINSIGNHDDQTSLMLPLILEPYYANEPRVTIETAPRFYHYYEFGKTLLGFYHGHRVKASGLPELMVADNREAVGRTEFGHWLTGHIHHESVKEFKTCTVESFRTLAAKDAWHAGSGYRSLRDIQSITYHKEYGEVGRDRISAKYLMAQMDQPTKES